MPSESIAGGIHHEAWFEAAEAQSFAVCTVSTLFVRPAAAQNPTAVGEFTIERPTLVSLGFEWRITGDDNRNAKVQVTYRRKGEQQWHDALPLMRSQHEKVGENGPHLPNMHPDPFHYIAPNMFAGSILDLEPGTEYECRFELSDPDGVKGQARKVVTVETRKEPEPAAGGHVYNVYPIDWKGPKQEPAFTGLMEAYYQGAASSDYENSYPPRVEPGDVILVHAGVYMSDRFHYLNGLPHPGYQALGTLFDGTYYLTASGTPDKPIVIKGAGDGEVIFDGKMAPRHSSIWRPRTITTSRESPSAMPTSSFCWASRTSQARAASL